MTDGCHFGVNSITGQHNAVKCFSEAKIDNFLDFKASAFLSLTEPSLSHVLWFSLLSNVEIQTFYSIINSSAVYNAVQPGSNF